MAPAGTRALLAKEVAGKLRRAFAGWQRPSVIALLAANLFAAYGVVFRGWTVFPVLMLYWLENLVVGGYNLLRMLVASPARPGQWLAKVLLIPFFVFHFGAFVMMHGFLVIAVFGRHQVEAPGLPPFEFGFPPFELARGIEYVVDLVRRCHLGYAFLAFAVSHGFSFVSNYIARGEFRRVLPENLMGRPYGRVVVMHVAILFGAFLMALLGTPVAALMLLVALKTGIDVLAHLHEHRKMGTIPGSKAAAEEA